MIQKTNSKTPNYEVFHVVGGDKHTKGNWTKIGACWTHEDEEGFNMVLNYIPTNDALLVIRKPKPKQEK